jgi:hypothetical protein
LDGFFISFNLCVKSKNTLPENYFKPCKNRFYI